MRLFGVLEQYKWDWSAMVCAAALAAGWLSGCRAQPRSLTVEQLEAHAAAERNSAQSVIEAFSDRLVARLDLKCDEYESGRSAEVPTLNVVAFSGGADFGAFGAGFMRGWGEVQAPRHRRSEFDAVTGVSTGALLAMYAFLNTDEAFVEIDELYRNPAPDWVRERGLLFFLPHFVSFMKIPGLERDIRAAVDTDLIWRLAAQTDRGKVLVVSATSLDLGVKRTWDLGAEAQAARASGDYEKVVRILLASGAVPAVFPPVEIDGLLYADGGITANVLLSLNPEAPWGPIQKWRSAFPERPMPRLRYWVIVNNQLLQSPSITEARWPPIVSSALSTAIRSATLAEIRWLAAEARFANSLPGVHVEVRVAAIPDDWRPPVSGSFRPETMRSLSDLGRKMGADPESWTIWVMPGQAEDFVP